MKELLAILILIAIAAIGPALWIVGALNYLRNSKGYKVYISTSMADILSIIGCTLTLCELLFIALLTAIWAINILHLV